MNISIIKKMLLVSVLFSTVSLPYSPYYNRWLTTKKCVTNASGLGVGLSGLGVLLAGCGAQDAMNNPLASSNQSWHKFVQSVLLQGTGLLLVQEGLHKIADACTPDDLVYFTAPEIVETLKNVNVLQYVLSRAALVGAMVSVIPLLEEAEKVGSTYNTYLSMLRTLALVAIGITLNEKYQNTDAIYQNAEYETQVSV